MRLRCEGCERVVDASAQHPHPAACPRAGADDVDHLLVPLGVPAPQDDGDPNPFVAFRHGLSSYLLAREQGLSDADFVVLVRQLDRRLVEVDGVGFVRTPLRALPGLAQRVGVAALYAKDETHNVSGSHKSRHLMGLALHLELVGQLGWLGRDTPLAIASCGNAALAAAVVARAAGRPLQVFIPEDADPIVVARLGQLQAQVQVCRRRPGERGDPCWRRFQQAVAAGALPFCVQGPANGLTLEGGQTLGWELAAQLPQGVDHLLVQVGGGALGSSTARAMPRGWFHHLHTVQTEGAWPLRRALLAVDARADEIGIDAALRAARQHRGEVMWPWESVPHSVAHGILDDETYDWHRLVAAMILSGGEAVVASEAQLQRARELAQAAGVGVSATGSAGLAGLLALRGSGVIGAEDRVVVLFTGVER